MSAKWRPITPPILGKQLSDALDRIEELERAISSRSGVGGAGGAGGAGGPEPSPLIQGGEATTGADGRVTVTFPNAFPSTPIVLVSVLNSGTDQLVAAIESISTTQVVISVGKIAQQGTAGLYTGQGEGHQHGPGSFAAAAHDHAPGTFAVAVPAGTDGSSGTFGVAGVSAQSGPHAVSGVSAPESSHRHPAPADNVLHTHDRTLVSGVGVRWIAMPKT